MKGLRILALLLTLSLIFCALAEETPPTEAPMEGAVQEAETPAEEATDLAEPMEAVEPAEADEPTEAIEPTEAAPDEAAVATGSEEAPAEEADAVPEETLLPTDAPMQEEPPSPTEAPQASPIPASTATECAHEPVADPAVAPGCVASGWTEGSHCALCGAILEPQVEIPPRGHTPAIDPAVLPTPEQSGRSEGVHCAVCGAVLVEPMEIPPTLPVPIRQGASHTMKEGDVLRLFPLIALTDGWTLRSIQSADSQIVQADMLGNVYALRAGETQILLTLECEGVALRSLVTIKVEPAIVPSISLSPADSWVMFVGETLRLTPTVVPEGDALPLVWKSSNEKILRVENGLVTAIDHGSAVITVSTEDGRSASIEIVAEPPILPTSTNYDTIADLSHYNGVIDWATAREILDFVILRATVGDKKDNQYATNAKKCALPFGAYHYVKAGTAEEARIEAEFFYSVATANGIEPLFFVADIEYEAQNKDTTRPVFEAFVQRLRELGAETVGVYISQNRYAYIKGVSDKADFVWIPRWGKNEGVASSSYEPAYTCDLWQYTSNGYVPGIEGDVDLNLLLGKKSIGWYTGTEKVVRDYGLRVVVTGDSVAIRTGAGTSFAVIETVSAGKKLLPITDSNGLPILSSNGWYAVRATNQVGWISRKYVKVTTGY
ncbi:MAG: hypothetical protein IJ234_04195 [Clostridia bacterium]|nr:hypothetical protein [Clostridia bacterium]